MSKQTITDYRDLQFAPLSEGNPVEAAMLWGNPETGPAAVMVRFPEGHKEPWHSHSSTYHSVLIKGSFQTHTKGSDDSTPDTFGPGSYTIQPGGDVHAEVNAGEGELVALVYFEGPIDVVLAD